MNQKIKILFVLFIFVFTSKGLAYEQVVTSHPLATEVGQKILQDGGNAYDAAVAISATLSVVEPFASGLGGGGFWLMYDNESKAHIFLDAREVSPAKATLSMYLDAQENHVKSISREGPLAAGIPGLPAALSHVSTTYGKLPLSRTLLPAIHFAENGFDVDERYVRGAKYKKELLLKYPESSAIFLDRGEVPNPGWTLYQKDLAHTLKMIGDFGHEGFYMGSFANRLVKSINQNGGVWRLDDLQNYNVVERDPITFTYKNHRFTAPGLPSSGALMLKYIFASLESYNTQEMTALQVKHLISELLKRAFFLRNSVMGDPDTAGNKNIEINITNLAKNLPKVSLDKATSLSDFPIIDSFINEGMSTTHFAVVDRYGNRVAVTQSINFWFGSGFVPQGTGVLLNNEMDDFIFDEKKGDERIANLMQPSKRMLSSMTPLMIESDRGYTILGTPGGKRIISMVLLSSLEWINGGDAMSIASLPRYHHQFTPDHILYEKDAISESERLYLETMGHNLKESSRLYGNMQVITWDKKKQKLDKASDPRGLPKSNSRVY